MPGRSSQQGSDQVPADAPLHSNSSGGGISLVIDAKVLLGDRPREVTPEMIVELSPGIRQFLRTQLQRMPDLPGASEMLQQLQETGGGPIPTAAEAASTKDSADPPTIRFASEQFSTSQASSSSGRQSTSTPQPGVNILPGAADDKAGSTTGSAGAKDGGTAAAGTTVKWPMICKQIDQLRDSAGTCPMDPEQLAEVCENIREMAVAARIEAAGSATHQLAVRATCKLPHLLSQVLAARKRARDWKQASYSFVVRSVLTAGVFVMQLDGGRYNQLWVESMEACDVASKVSAAQLEVAQLLAAQQQQQNRDQQQLLQTTCELAQMLLAWWRLALRHWMAASAYTAFPAAVAYAFADPAHPLKLAVTLSQALQADSPRTQWRIVEVFLITHTVHTLAAAPDKRMLIRKADATALLQLSVAMLLLCSYEVQQQSFSQQQGQPDGSSCRTAAGSSTTTSSSSSSVMQPGTSTIIGVKGGLTDQQLDQQQKQQQLADVTMQLWCAAGYSPTALPVLAFRVAASSALAQEVLESLSHYSFQQLPAGAPNIMRLFVLSVEYVGCCLTMCSSSKQLAPQEISAMKQSHEFDLDSLPKLENMSPQQVQLLQAIVWPLPQLLLLTAQQGTAGSSTTGGTQLSLVAITTAWWCLCAWHIPGLHAAATTAAISAARTRASTAAALAGSKKNKTAQSAAVSTVQPLSELLGPLLDCWLQLMGQQLLALLLAVNTALQHSTAFDCSLIRLLSHLALLLQPLSHIAAVSVWSSRLPHIMLLLEVINRQLLPLPGVSCKCSTGCSSTGCSSTGCSNTGCSTGCSSTGCSTGRSCGSRSFQKLHLCASDHVRKVVALLATVMQQQHLGLEVTASGPEGHLAEQQQAQQLQQQYFALVVSSMKTQLLQCVAFDCLGMPVIGPALADAAAAKMQAVHSPMKPAHTTKPAELCAVLTPWVVLLGRWLLFAGCGLQQLVGNAAALAESGIEHVSPMAAMSCAYGAHNLVSTASKACTALLRAGDTLAMCTTLDQLLYGADIPAAVHPERVRFDDAAREACSTSAVPADRAQSDVIVANTSSSSRSNPASSHQQSTPDAAARLMANDQDQDQLLLQHEQQGKLHNTVGQRMVLRAHGDLRAALSALSQGNLHQSLNQAVVLVDQAARRVEHLEKNNVAQQGSADGSSSGSARHSSEPEGREASTESQLAGLDVFLELQKATGSSQLLDELLEGISHANSSAECMQLLFSQFSPNSPSPELFELPQALQAAGRALCAQLPVPWMCNNPDCTNMAGASELQLVGGSSCVCGGCRVARYCSRECQASHWQEHKPVCRELAAAETPAGGTPGATLATTTSTGDDTGLQAPRGGATTMSTMSDSEPPQAESASSCLVT